MRTQVIICFLALGAFFFATSGAWEAKSTASVSAVALQKAFYYCAMRNRAERGISASDNKLREAFI